MNFSLPSLAVIWDSAFKTFQRFSLVIGSSIIGAIAVVWLINNNGASDQFEAKFFALGFVGVLGISWFFSITVFLEQLQAKAIISWPFLLAALIAIVGYYLYLDTILIDAVWETWYQLALFFIATHLFSAFAPFTTSDSLDQFWEFNKTLFLRFLISGVYSAALFIGLSVAMLALDQLLEINIEEEFYPSLFIIIAVVFNTWFFLSGVPSKEIIPKKEIEYPTGLKVFVQYVLISLVTVYIFILYAYLIKIILQWELPNGWVSNLVLSFSIAGILSLLLLYPIQNDDGKKWIQLFSKWYYRALIPLLILLFFSIWVRISEYGVTINRYFVATLGVWLTFIVIYFVFSRARSIKVVPISLTVFVIFSAIGPFSALNVSEQSQLSRLLAMSQSEDMLNSVEEMQALDISEGEILQINSVVRYIVENHGNEAFESILDMERSSFVADSIDSGNRNTGSKFIVEKVIGLPWRSAYSSGNNDGSQNYSYSSTNTGSLNISEFEFYLGSFNFYSYDQSYDLSIDGIEHQLVFNNESLEFNLNSESDTLIIPLSEKVKSLHENNQGDWYSSIWSPSKLEILGETDQVKVLFLITYITGNSGETESVTNITIQVFAK